MRADSIKQQQSLCNRADRPFGRARLSEFPETGRDIKRVFTFNSLFISLFLLFLLLVSACSQQPQLNSERIASRYGNYGIEVLKSDGDMRVSDLYSSDNGYRTTRTLAIVQFASPIDPRVTDLHRAIVNGASIGATFKSAGWLVHKETMEICSTRPVASTTEYLSGMHLDGNPGLAVHRYRFEVRRDNQRVDYAVITEIHHPDYLGAEDLTVAYVRRKQDYVETGEACLVRR